MRNSARMSLRSSSPATAFGRADRSSEPSGPEIHEYSNNRNVIIDMRLEVCYHQV